MTGVDQIGVDQIVVSASRRDAITTAALNAREVLREVGPSHLLAHHVHHELRDDVLALDGDGDGGDDGRDRDGHDFKDATPLILHASIGDERVQRHVLERPGPVVLQYHNITPPRFFACHDPRFARLLALGRHQLHRLRPVVAGSFADTEYNAADLEAMGYDDVRVVPLVLGADRLRQLAPHEPTAHHLRVAVSGPVILCVAQLLPHKRVDLILQAYSLLVTHHLPEATLIIVGAERHPHFAESIRSLVHDLGLVRCWLATDVDDDVLAAMYGRADVMVVASEHEGLCVPLVEAMAFEIPIVARANAAIPETVGDAALLLPGDAGAGLLAEALLAVLSDGALHAELRQRSATRLAAFDPEAARAALLANLASVL